MMGLDPSERFDVIHGKKLVVVMPAYNAQATLERTWREMPAGFVDEVIVVDDASRDDTVAAAQRLGLRVIRHPRNRGYGGNQKTCYREALAAGADVVVMLHPDYQYTPQLVPAMASMVATGTYDVVLGSRILGGKARRGGMPLYKYISNRALTLFENLAISAKLSEYHTGYRAFSRAVLEQLPLEENDDDFVFDNEMIAQAHYFGFRIGELSCPTRYAPESSSISFVRSLRYGLGVVRTSMVFRLSKLGLVHWAMFSERGRRLDFSPGAQAGQPSAANEAEAVAP